MVIFGSHLEYPVWLPSTVFLNGTITFLDSKNVYLDIKVSIICHLEAETLLQVYFSYGSNLENSLRPPSADFLNDTVVFIDSGHTYCLSEWLGYIH